MRERGEPVVIAHPGIAFTGITAHYPKWLFTIIKNPMKLIFMKPRLACLSIFYALFYTPAECYWIGPSLFDVWGMPSVKRLNSCDEEEYEFISDTTDGILKELEKDN